jgi:anti-sigma factor RsiW
MNNCTNIEIQEMLPDLLRQSLAAADRTRIESHLAGCSACVEELRVLQLVKSAAVFVPAIDAASIARQIPPYRAITPDGKQPARRRMVTWLAAAGAAVVVAVVGGALTLNHSQAPTAVAVTAVDSNTHTSTSAPDIEVAAAPSGAAPTSTAPSSSRTHALGLAADVDGLSDGSLMQLMDDMTTFDGLPAAEPEQVLTVDTGENSGQD